MKTINLETLSFTPGAAGIGTIDFAAFSNFDKRRVIAVLNETRNALIYRAASLPYGGTFAGTVLTLAFDTSTHNAADDLQLIYDEQDLGAASDTAASTDTGTFSLIALFKRLLGKFSSLGQNTMANSVPVVVSSDQSKIPFYSAQTTVAGLVQASPALNYEFLTNSSSGWYDARQFRHVSFNITTGAGISAGVLTFEWTNDPTLSPNGFALSVQDMASAMGSLVTTLTLAASTSRFFNTDVKHGYFRIRVSTAVTGGNVTVTAIFSGLPYAGPVLGAMNLASFGGTAVVNGGVAGVQSVGGNVAHSAAATANPVPVGGRAITTLDTSLVNNDTCYLMLTTAGQLIMKPYGSAENDWQYAAVASGIVNTTTAVTIRAAGATNIRNYITGVTVMAEALTNATELVIRDGASGTVIWRIKIPTTGLPLTDITFLTPLRGTAATLLEVATLTASGAGAVYFNARGYQSF